MGSFVKLPYQPRPGLGSKIDFGWYAIGIHYTPSIETGTRLVCGTCILYTWYCNQYKPGIYFILPQVATRLVLSQLIPACKVLHTNVYTFIPSTNQYTTTTLAYT